MGKLKTMLLLLFVFVFGCYDDTFTDLASKGAASAVELLESGDCQTVTAEDPNPPRLKPGETTYPAINWVPKDFCEEGAHLEFEVCFMEETANGLAYSVGFNGPICGYYSMEITCEGGTPVKQDPICHSGACSFKIPSDMTGTDMCGWAVTELAAWDSGGSPLSLDPDFLRYFTGFEILPTGPE